METDEEDRISELPKGLLEKILSHLPETRDAYGTRLVSKCWQFLWTLTDNLTLHIPDGVEIEHASINYIFDRLSSPKIRKFDLLYREMYFEREHVERWLSYVVQHKVEHVVLLSDFQARYTLPQLLCTCSSLVALTLDCCEFDKGVVISWKSLKTLHPQWMVELDDGMIQKILSACPALETLKLDFCTGFRHLEIKHSNLKRLSLIGIAEDGHSSDISAPHLQHLEISGRFYEFNIGDVSSLVNAVLYYDEVASWHRQHPHDDHCDHDHDFLTLVQDYLRKLRNVTGLTIYTWLAVVLFMLQLDGVQLPYMKYKCLTLSMQITKCSLCGAASLLRASPHLETLNIYMAAENIWYRCQFVSSYLRKGDNIDFESWISNFAFPNLRSVTIICFNNERDDEMCQGERHDKLFELSEFLLKNAMVLEKLVFIAKRSAICRKCSANCSSQYLSQVVAKLLGCPRLSTKSVISFRVSDFIY